VRGKEHPTAKSNALLHFSARSISCSCHCRPERDVGLAQPRLSGSDFCGGGTFNTFYTGVSAGRRATLTVSRTTSTDCSELFCSRTNPASRRMVTMREAARAEARTRADARIGARVLLLAELRRQRRRLQYAARREARAVVSNLPSTRQGHQILVPPILQEQSDA
jgi:hypothetical protein